MSIKPKVSLIGFLGLAFAGSALAQFDGAAFTNNLKTKYGPPLTRETFTARPGIEMIVDYAASGHICRIQLPPIGPSGRANEMTGQAIDDFLIELLPLTSRGRELRRFYSAVGSPSMASTMYENITISEAFISEGKARRRTGVIVTFPKEDCDVRSVNQSGQGPAQ